MNDPNCQQNVTCIYLHIQRKKHVLYTDSVWRNTCKVRKAILQSSKSKYVNKYMHTYVFHLFSISTKASASSSLISFSCFLPTSHPFFFHPSFGCKKNFPFQPKTTPEKKKKQFAIQLKTTSSHTKKHTPPKFNMEPENKSLEKEIAIWKPLFSGSMLNFGGVTKRRRKKRRFLFHLIVPASCGDSNPRKCHSSKRRRQSSPPENGRWQTAFNGHMSHLYIYIYVKWK